MRCHLRRFDICNQVHFKPLVFLYFIFHVLSLIPIKYSYRITDSTTLTLDVLKCLQDPAITQKGITLESCLWCSSNSWPPDQESCTLPPASHLKLRLTYLFLICYDFIIGAGVFVTTVVAGFIAIICPFDAMQRPFLRDIIFYLAAVFWTFCVLWDKKITKLEAIGKYICAICYISITLTEVVNTQLLALGCSFCFIGSWTQLDVCSLIWLGSFAEKVFCTYVNQSRGTMIIIEP